MNMNHADRGTNAVTWRLSLPLPGQRAAWAVIGAAAVAAVALSLLQLGKASASFTVRATTPPIEVIAPTPTASPTPSASPSPATPAAEPTPSATPSSPPVSQREEGTDPDFLNPGPPGSSDHSHEGGRSPHAPYSPYSDPSSSQVERHAHEPRGVGLE